MKVKRFKLLLLVAVIACAPVTTLAQNQPTNGGATAGESVEGPNAEIHVGSDKVDDVEIQKRIAELFTNIDALAGIESQVNAGVVRLTGSLPSKNEHGQALRLVSRIDGVVAVNDQLKIDPSLTRRMRRVTQGLVNRLFETLGYLPLLAVAFGSFLLFWLASGLLVRWDWLFRKFTTNPFLQSLLRQIVRGTMLLIGFIVLLEILDATALLGTILGAAGILGLAIGFAIRDTVENYLASILLSLRQPFDANDQVEIEGHEGLVIRLTSRETVLMTLDGNHVRIPNATVYKSIITNYSRNPKRRFNFEVGVDTAVNLNAARGLGISSLAATPGVVADPPPACRIQQLGDSNVVLQMLAWVDQAHNDFSKVRSEAIRMVKKAFDAADFEMPEPIYRLKLEGLDTSGVLKTSMPFPAPEITPQEQAGEPAPDVGREHYIERQIEQEKRSAAEEDLLVGTDNK